MSSYLKRLERDLPRWAQAGWVKEEGVPAILAEVGERAERGWFRLPLILAALGGVLVFAGVVSLIASNWEVLPHTIKLALPLGWMTIAFLAAYQARVRKSEGLAEGLSLMGTLMFGASIMLIGQIYHLPPDPPAFFMIWAVAAAVVSFLWPSSLNAGLAFVLAGIWTVIVTGGPDAFFFSSRPSLTFHWPFFLLWIPLVAICVREGWRRPLHVAGISLLLWSVVSGFPLFGGELFWGLKATILVLLLQAVAWIWPTAKEGVRLVSRPLWLGFGGWLLIASSPDTGFFLSHLLPAPVLGVMGGVLAISLWGMVRTQEKEIAGMGAIASLVPLLGLRLPGLPLSALLSVVVLAAALGSIIYGYRERKSFFVNAGFMLFGIKLTWVYFQTIWSLAGRSVWMIVGGILVIVLGILFDRYRRKMLVDMTAPLQENAR